MGKQDRLPTPVVAVVGLTVWLLLAVPILIVMLVAEAGRRTVQAIRRAVRRIRAARKNIALWSLTSITALATAGGLLLLGGCAELPRTAETRIDHNGNLAVLECVGECIFVEFDEIVPAGAQ